MSNFFISLVNWANRLLIMLGLRRRQLHWGVVYDSLSKQPLDPAIVKLVDAKTGKMVQRSVTDITGRYNFLAYPGKFKILVQKTNYSFPSTFVGGDSDEVYNNLYHGEFFELSGDSDAIPLNIPMDPIRRDWNQTAKAGYTRFHPYAESLAYRFIGVIFWFGLIFVLLAFWKHPSRVVEGLLAAYGVLVALAVLFPQPRLWGRVVFKKRPWPDREELSVEISFPQMPATIIAKSQVNEDGKFFLRLNPGRYLLQVKGYSETGRVSVYRAQKIRMGLEQAVNKNFVV
ncbi:MAG: hypothetical protein KGJ93_00860 [Patescibacteria group bacterium]|nr:hypothetical protein [Patescibacteria group bacterium]